MSHKWKKCPMAMAQEGPNETHVPDDSTDVSAGDDSIMEVAQSPKKVFEIDLTNSPKPVVTTKLIARTRPMPPPPLVVAPEVSSKDQANEASLHDDSTETSAGDKDSVLFYEAKDISSTVLSQPFNTYLEYPCRVSLFGIGLGNHRHCDQEVL